MPPRSAVPTRTRSTRVPAALRDVFASDEEEEGEPAPRDVSLGLEVLNEEGVAAVAYEQPQLTVYVLRVTSRSRARENHICCNVFQTHIDFHTVHIVTLSQ